MTLRLEVKAFRKDEKRTRKGYCELWFPDIGLCVRDVVVHVFAESEPPRLWVSMPAKPYTDEKGAQKWWPLVWFDRAGNEKVQDAARAQLKEIAPEIFAGAVHA